MESQNERFLDAIVKYIDNEIKPHMDTSAKRFGVELVKTAIKENPKDAMSLVKKIAPTQYADVIDIVANLINTGGGEDFEMMYNILKKTFVSEPRVTFGRMTFTVSDLEKLKSYMEEY